MSELNPHEAPPNMANSFMTRYDYDYNKGDPPLRPLVADGSESGHSKNRPLFGRPTADDWGSVTHRTYLGRRGVPIPDSLPELAAAAGKSRVLATAHIRGEPSTAGFPRGEEAPVSTYKEHYPRKFTTAPNGGNYAGNLTTLYKPWLLAIDSLDDDGVGKSKKPKGWRPEDDLNRPTTANGTRQPKDSLGVFGPRSGEGQPWGTEYGTYGNKALEKPSLLPKGFGESTVAGDRSSGDKRRLMEALAGRRPTTTAAARSEFETNPIPMRPDERDACRVGKRLPLEGPVDMTIYQSDYVRQGNKPELRDAPRDKTQGPQLVNGKGPAPQPERDLHPSTVRSLERRGVGEVADRHLHKYRPYDGCGSPTDTMHSSTAGGGGGATSPGHGRRAVTAAVASSPIRAQQTAVVDA